MAGPVMLVLNRNYTLATTKGHVIQFVKGVPTAVPKSVYNDAIAIGAQPPDGTAPDIKDEDEKSDIPQDPAERNPLIYAAILKLVKRNEREDFTAAGSPTVDAVTREVGFKVAAREIAPQWQAYHDAEADKKANDD